MIDFADKKCKSCIYRHGYGDKDYCRRFPPIKFDKFPRVDPYYTTCGEYKKAVYDKE